ncbi:MAG: aminopeptidase P family protein, partial [Clostridia bacterium]|nr:aminopeptidase P family protein [Clostridia bacterium]
MKTAKERLLNALAPDVDGVFVSSELNIFYLTNFDYTDGFVLVTRNKSYVITDFRYAEAAKAAVSDEFEIVVPQNRMLIEIASLLEENGVKKLMFEDGFVSCADHARFADLFKGCELVPGGTDVLSTLREVKTEAELEKINAAQKITDAAFAHILEFIKPEMTELEVALELEFFMRRMGAQSTAFDTIAVSGASSSLPHGVPQARKLEKGFFTMDFGA